MLVALVTRKSHARVLRTLQRVTFVSCEGAGSRLTVWSVSQAPFGDSMSEDASKPLGACLVTDENLRNKVCDPDGVTHAVVLGGVDVQYACCFGGALEICPCHVLVSAEEQDRLYYAARDKPVSCLHCILAEAEGRA
jgi:hypothetical protein